jgi:hypothetical protein
MSIFSTISVAIGTALLLLFLLLWLLAGTEVHMGGILPSGVSPHILCCRAGTYTCTCTSLVLSCEHVLITPQIPRSEIRTRLDHITPNVIAQVLPKRGADRLVRITFIGTAQSKRYRSKTSKFTK